MALGQQPPKDIPCHKAQTPANRLVHFVNSEIRSRSQNRQRFGIAASGQTSMTYLQADIAAVSPGSQQGKRGVAPTLNETNDSYSDFFMGTHEQD